MDRIDWNLTVNVALGILAIVTFFVGLWEGRRKRKVESRAEQREVAAQRKSPGGIVLANEAEIERFGVPLRGPQDDRRPLPRNRDGDLDDAFTSLTAAIEAANAFTHRYLTTAALNGNQSMNRAAVYQWALGLKHDSARTLKRIDAATDAVNRLTNAERAELDEDGFLTGFRRKIAEKRETAQYLADAASAVRASLFRKHPRPRGP